ncbi:FAD-binding oxidoreductase [Kaustia mangrovi]|uniref:FAD-binding oxidoreductase n=1 Tax=Kaustia mangrovi TaxID=2593653 RepID=A0A7S8C385_9HYPH|nr:FAD-binding oxidoreductase [Kaustia mangrovi]QPC42543.1 FAD-binding oxidoreductase [Kaustia mangrovi]
MSAVNGDSEAPSYYLASANRYVEHPVLRGEVRTDVCVVGAGFTGLSAALELAERGYRVVVVEAETVGWGASGRNGGQICTGFSSGMEPIEAQLGPDDARKCFEIAEEGKAIIAERIARHAIACDLKWGYLHVAAKPGAMADLSGMQASLQRYGCETELLDRESLRERLGTDRYHGALHEAGAGHFHPLNYCLGMADAAIAAGVEIYEHSRATRIESGPDPVVHTGEGLVRARFVVVAGNAYLGRTVKPLHTRIMPVGSFLVATEPLGEERARTLIRDDEAVADTNYVLDYFRLSGDRRMIFGGGCTYSGVIPDDIAARMGRRMTRIFPGLADARIDYAWGGFIGITVNRIPDLGTVGGTVFYAQGFSGQGVTLGNICGRLMAEAVAGQAERFDLMARFRHQPFPGGPVRTPLLVLAMAWYRLRDMLG